MKLLDNKAICLILMVVLIVSGTWISGYRGFSRLYNSAEKVFFTGEDGDGICIANDLSERVIAATNLVTMASGYSAVQGEVQSVADAAADLSNASDIASMSRCNQELDTAVTALYNALGDQQLTEKHESYRQSLYADFTSRGHTISHDPYNQYAQAYNEALRGFPAGLLASVTPVPAEAVIFY